MDTRTNNDRLRENLRRVRDLLLKSWDPIGIQDIKEANDEYDRYADRAYEMLMHEGATAEMIASYLAKIAIDHMGLKSYQSGKDISKNVAKALVALRPEF